MEDWLAFLEGVETIGAISNFHNKEEGWRLELYAEDYITQWIAPDKLWLQNLVHTIRNNVPGKHLVLLDFRHFPSTSELSHLRKSLVLCNKVKVVIKFSGSLFWRNESDIVYLLVLKPTESNFDIGKILLGDFTSQRKVDDFYGSLIGILTDFLNGKLFTSPVGTKTVKINELKEPFILDPSKYVR